MKKTAATLTLAFGIMVLSLTNVQAINTARLSAKVLTIHSDIAFENTIEVENWMLSFDARQMDSEKVMEQNISLEPWMIDANWNDNNEIVVSEFKIELEDWMIQSFTPNNRILALKTSLM